VDIFHLFSIRLLNRNRATVQPIRSRGKGNLLIGILMLDRYD
jgi:hypothetical protein